MQKPKQNNKTFIIKDTIIFNQKDSIIIKSSDLKELNTQFKEIKHDINNHLNKEKETFFGASYDTVFTVVFTILIFTIGIIIDRWLKKNQEKKELKGIKTYFLNQIQDIKLNILPFLSDAYKKFYQEIISIDKGIPTSPPKLLTNSYKRLLNLETTQLFNSIEDKSDYNTYFGEIDFLDRFTNELNDYHSIVLKRSEIIRNKISILDADYMDLLALFTEFEKNNNQDFDKKNSHYHYIGSFVSLYHSEINGQRNLKKYYKEIIRPVQNYVVSTNLFRTHPIGSKISEKGKSISKHYNELRLLVVEVRLEYRKFKKYIDNSLEKLNEIS